MTKSAKIYLFILGMRIATILPRALTVILAKNLMSIGYLFAEGSRKTIKKNLSYCQQKRLSDNTYKTFINYAVYLSDLLRIPVFDMSELKSMVDIKGIENLDTGLASNRGAILMTAHIGNWDLAGVYVASLGYPLTAVVEEIPELSDFYNFLRTRTGMKTVFMREKDKMISALKNNRILVLLGDRDLTNRGIPVKFLSGEKAIPRGPAAFAIKYNVPIIFGYFVMEKSKNNLYKAEISKPIFPENRSFDELTQIIADRLSEYINLYPTQWFVFKDEWLN
jgi:KDO2-lipid IV(A) lauroyltransferase